MISSHVLTLPRMVAVLLSALALVSALFADAQIASAQEQPTSSCVGAYLGSPTGNSCTAAGVQIASLAPSVVQACTSAQEASLVRFRTELQAGASKRWDVGLFVATDGQSALTGASCYHDTLKPAFVAGVTPPVNLTSGDGAFRNDDGDFCADIFQSDGSTFYTVAPIWIQCVDNNQDQIVDPVSTCVSWDNNASGAGSVCNSAADAVPSADSKCRCESIAPSAPILIYRGYDFGDLPESYGTTVTIGNGNPTGDGAYHAIQDPAASGTPATQGGIPAVWLGARVDYSPLAEANGVPSVNADSDDLNTTADEDGVELIGPWLTGQSNGGKIAVSVSASEPSACHGNRCYLGFWIDWNQDGAFNPAPFTAGGEAYAVPVSVGNAIKTFAIPFVWQSPLYMRFRLYYEQSGVQGMYGATGLAANGEVEDHRRGAFPLAVILHSFSAACEAETPVIAWQTVTEINTAGFNVWRGASPNEPQTQLNPAMIPAHPGSTQGYSYSFADTSAQLGVTYFYWLQDIGLDGTTGLNGPVSTTCSGPTAVTIDRVDAGSAGVPAVIWWTPLIALVGGIVLAGLLSRRAKTR